MSKKKVKSEGNAKLPPPAIEETVRFFEGCLNTVFEERGEFFSSAIKEKLSHPRLEGTARAGDAPEWTAIDSLSKLRAVVGGRFQNIKNKWIAAGFPIRESKGAEIEPYEVVQAGWIDLSTWISNQGFEARLKNGDKSCLFEIKAAK